MKVTVIDYGLSNLLSVRRALEHCGAEVSITNTPSEILSAERLILPGVGAFHDGMAGLQSLNLIEPIRQKAAEGTPLLGICLGMQMLFDESDEFGLCKGLGLIPGRVEKIPSVDTDGAAQRVPHIGWNKLLVPVRDDDLIAGCTTSNAPAHTTPQDQLNGFQGTLLENITPGQECYFVHSFEAKPADIKYRLADTVYGGRRICAAAADNNVIGTQFHPEKSGPVGLRILQGFLQLSVK